MSVSFLISLFSFCLDELFSIVENGVLKSPTTILWVFMYDLSFNNVSFTNVGALLNGT